MKSPSFQSIALGIHKCIDNAERYIIAGELLMKRDKQSSYLLFLYALEELGKVVMISTFVFYAHSEIKLEEWKKRFRDHSEKFWFSKELDSFMEGNLPSLSDKAARSIAKKKLLVAYVDFDGKDFISPKMINEKELDEVDRSCRQRLTFVKSIHSSVEKDARIIEKKFAELNGLSLNELLDLMKEKMKNNTL